MRSRRLFALLVCVAAGAVVHASTPVQWQTMASADFLKGDATGVSIDTLGRVTLGPAASVVADLETAAAWRMPSGVHQP